MNLQISRALLMAGIAVLLICSDSSASTRHISVPAAERALVRALPKIEQQPDVELARVAKCWPTSRAVRCWVELHIEGDDAGYWEILYVMHGRRCGKIFVDNAASDQRSIWGDGCRREPVRQ